MTPDKHLKIWEKYHRDMAQKIATRQTTKIVPILEREDLTGTWFYVDPKLAMLYHLFLAEFYKTGA